MKKVTKPAEKEEAVYYSDFSGKTFGEFFPHVEVNIEFNYSQFMGTCSRKVSGGPGGCLCRRWIY